MNLQNLKAKLVQSGFIGEKENLTIEGLKAMLNERFEQVNFEYAKEDVLPFIKDKSELDLWGKEFFTEITKKIQAV